MMLMMLMTLITLMMLMMLITLMMLMTLITLMMLMTMMASLPPLGVKPRGCYFRKYCSLPSPSPPHVDCGVPIALRDGGEQQTKCKPATMQG